MLKELVKKTRSYRNFDRTEEIGSDTLKEVISLCRYTASAGNMQSLKFAYINKIKDCDEVFKYVKFAAYLDNKIPYSGNEPTAYIVICNDENIRPSAHLIDVGIVAQTIVLGLAEKGIGSCMIGSFDKEGITKTFRLPENISPSLVIALGIPNEQVEICDIKNNDHKYYRTENDLHMVPKRPLDELLLD